MMCEYCDMAGEFRAGEKDGLNKDVHVCKRCWELLKNPQTALPLIRSHLTMKLKGRMPPSELDRTMNVYMEKISKWTIRN